MAEIVVRKDGPGQWQVVKIDERNRTLYLHKDGTWHFLPYSPDGKECPGIFFTRTNAEHAAGRAANFIVVFESYELPGRQGIAFSDEDRAFFAGQNFVGIPLFADDFSLVEPLENPPQGKLTLKWAEIYGAESLERLSSASPFLRLNFPFPV